MAGKKNSSGKETAGTQTQTEYAVTRENAFKAIEDGLDEIFGGYMKIFLGLARCSEDMRDKALSMMKDMDAPVETDAKEDVPADSVEQAVERPQEQENGGNAADTPPWEDSTQVTNPAQTTATAQAAPASPITKDDLLREIQAKFRKDRRNQEKVRSILLAYGASGLSLLPADKYADFLNDVRQL